MALIEINYHPSRRELRQFAGIWFPLLLVIISIWLWRLVGVSAALAVLLPALAAAAVGVARPEWFRRVYVGWMIVTFPLGWLMSHVVLAAIYYLLFTPLGLAMRLLGHDPMRRKLQRGESTTYWIARPDRQEPGRYYRQF